MNGSFITVQGNLTRDPELRFTQSGKAVLDLSIASNRSWKVGDEWEEEVTFYKATCWDSLAEHCADLEKGNAVIAYGALQLEKWENDDGEERTNLNIRAEDVGVSLSRQSVGDVQRMEKKSGGDDGGGRRSGRGGGKSSRGGSSGRKSRGNSGGRDNKQGYSNDEEPF